MKVPCKPSNQYGMVAHATLHNGKSPVMCTSGQYTTTVLICQCGRQPVGDPADVDVWQQMLSAGGDPPLLKTLSSSGGGDVGSAAESIVQFRHLSLQESLFSLATPGSAAAVAGQNCLHLMKLRPRHCATPSSSTRSASVGALLGQCWPSKLTGQCGRFPFWATRTWHFS